MNLNIQEFFSALRSGNNLIFTVKVIPRSSRTQIAGRMDDGTLKIRLKAPPEHGKANAELLSFLAKELHVPVSQITMLTGHTTSRKRLALSL